MAPVDAILVVLVVAVLLVVVAVSRAARYFVKLGFWYVMLTLLGLVMIPLGFLRPMNPANLMVMSSILRQSDKLLGCSYALEGLHNLKDVGAGVVVANHQHAIDGVGMNRIWFALKRCTIVAKKEVKYGGTFGLSLWLSGVVFIDKLDAKKSRDEINKLGTRLKSENLKLWMYPEGTRRNTGEIHAFKKGAFHVAVKAQVPVLPLVFSEYYFLDDDQKRFDNGFVIISALPPISTNGLSSDDVDDLIQRTHTAMSQEFSRISTIIKAKASTDRKKKATQ